MNQDRLPCPLAFMHLVHKYYFEYIKSETAKQRKRMLQINYSELLSIITPRAYLSRYEGFFLEDIVYTLAINCIMLVIDDGPGITDFTEPVIIIFPRVLNATLHVHLGAKAVNLIFFY
jgi:hypothetical protein